MAQATQQRGVTLIEMIVSLAVVVILLAIAVPNLEQLRLRNRVQLVAQTMMTDLQQARSEAILRSDTIHFRFSRNSQGSCYLIYAGSSGACRCDDSGQAVCTAAGQLVKQEWLPSTQRLSIHANVSSMSFQARQGLVTSTGSIEIGTANGQAIRHIVSIAGRVRSCSPGGSFKAMPKCAA